VSSRRGHAAARAAAIPQDRAWAELQGWPELVATLGARRAPAWRASPRQSRRCNSARRPGMVCANPARVASPFRLASTSMAVSNHRRWSLSRNVLNPTAARRTITGVRPSSARSASGGRSAPINAPGKKVFAATSPTADQLDAIGLRKPPEITE
jgi:hypothetical protein